MTRVHVTPVVREIRPPSAPIVPDKAVVARGQAASVSTGQRPSDDFAGCTE